MKQLFLALSAIVLASCAAVETPITKYNNQIQTPNYSFVAPPDRGWHLSKTPDYPDKSRVDILSLRKKVGPFMYQIGMMKRGIPKKFRAWPAERAVDNYRPDQLRKMMRAAAAGKYDIRDVVYGEEVVGNKRFFTMTYTRVSKTVKGAELRSAAYLYFPKEENNEWFLFTHYTEGGLSVDILANSRRTEFLEILESLSVSP